MEKASEGGNPLIQEHLSVQVMLGGCTRGSPGAKRSQRDEEDAGEA